MKTMSLIRYQIKTVIKTALAYYAIFYTIYFLGYLLSYLASGHAADNGRTIVEISCIIFLCVICSLGFHEDFRMALPESRFYKVLWPCSSLWLSPCP